MNDRRWLWVLAAVIVLVVIVSLNGDRIYDALLRLHGMAPRHGH